MAGSVIPTKGTTPNLRHKFYKSAFADRENFNDLGEPNPLMKVNRSPQCKGDIFAVDTTACFGY
jgi:hypothetical protein